MRIKIILNDPSGFLMLKNELENFIDNIAHACNMAAEWGRRKVMSTKIRVFNEKSQKIKPFCSFLKIDK